MSPYLFSADLGATEIGRKARAATLVSDLQVLSISDLFADYAAARRSGDLARMKAIRDAVKRDPALASELDGFDYPAAA
ncbi:hypothetical protein [Streptomyces sp. NRRL S-813]|uniref:hypothetical protein n=1 Tax=Streptomyces sp. NRRL S-813 TaxID=1463919 RepID=UPI0004BF1F2D|nr:hypothetical protein [Streptomyces sp. NRRL S-813]